MSKAQIENALREAKTYYAFWNQNRHLPTAAVTADYFAQRIYDLERQLNDFNKQSNTDRQHRAAPRAKGRR